jgi:S1-C subfamily serine protease
MRFRSVLLGSVITLALVFALIVGCVGGLVAAPYLQRQLGGFRLTSAAPINSNPAQPAAPAPVRSAPLQVTPAPTPTAVPLPANASTSERTASDVYRKVSGSVVYIQVTQNGSSSSGRSQIPGFPNIPSQPPSGVQVASGSGFVLDKDGHIVTNDHVVDGADTVEVTFLNGPTVHATVVGKDPSADLAVIKVDVDPSLLQPVELGDSSALVVGQNVFAIGNPFGQLWTMTSGIVSAVGRTIQSGTSSYSIPEVVQTDAAINPGNSGGPLVDTQGRVVGVNAQIESQAGSSSGVGFAIPVNIVKRVAPALIKDGHYNYAWLGITGTSLTLDLNEAMNLAPDQKGALVINVASGSPSAKAGIQGSQNQATINGAQAQVGGDVIVAVDGQPVTGMDGIIDYLFTSKQPGDKITLTVLRDGQQKDIVVTLGQRPANPNQ